MVSLLRCLLADWRDKYSRFNFVLALIRNVPGSFGMELRGRYIPRFFAACGRHPEIGPGLRLRGVHKITAGDNLAIGVDNFLQASGGLVFGNDVMLGPNVKIWTINHRFDDTRRPIRDQGYIYEEVRIGDGVWLGADVFVMPGVHIPEGCVVAASSVVGKKKYPPYSLLAGYPARVVGQRRPPAAEGAAEGERADADGDGAAASPQGGDEA